MIKQIQLRGLSREPSDRMTEDGGCAESLNVTLTNEELAPTLAPRNVTSVVVGSGAASNATDKYVYVHQVAGEENYIAMTSGGAFYVYIQGNRTQIEGLSLSSGETFNSITSIGNTLIISTNLNMHYVLYKNGSYLYLGTKIPEPQVKFVATPVERTSQELAARKYSAEEFGSFGDHSIAILLTSRWTAAFWNGLANKYDSGEYIYGFDEGDITYSQAINLTSEFIWSKVQSVVNSDRDDDTFVFPIFVRSAVKLFDGSYIYQSVPFLLHSGHNRSITVDCLPLPDDSSSLTKVMGINLDEFTAKAEVDWEIGDWGDIVRGVDFFISTDVCNPKMNARVNGAFDVSSQDVLSTFKFLGQSTNGELDDIREELLSKVNFYQIESMNSDEFSGGSQTIDIKAYGQDELVVRPKLPDDFLSHHGMVAIGGISSYNQRLIYNGVKTTIYPGYEFLQSTVYQTGESLGSDVYVFKYYIQTEQGIICSVISQNASGSEMFTYDTIIGDSATLYGIPQGFMYYPDPRCFKVEIYRGTASGPEELFTLKMAEHPGLNGAYALCSLDENIVNAGTESSASGEYPTSEDPTYEDWQKLLMSEAYNPWSFPSDNRATFNEDIITTATTTKALSAGQFGEFPLYVFTRGGIWALPISDTGALTAPSPLSRDVVISADGVTPIDQAIVYITSRGVALLTGSDCQDLSPNMSGPHYSLEEEASDLLDDTPWEDLIPVVTDSTPFNQFMATSKCLYDYAGKRLIFFNTALQETAQYQYILQLETGVWHKQSLIPQGVSFVSKINSYPESYACCMYDGFYAIYDFANVYDPSMVQATLPGIVITRGINLDQSFARKSITDLKIRGYIDRNSENDKIKYILMGSSDGIHYGVVSSLRGSSYKFYRLVILLDLDAGERVSWIDMEFDPRLQNKLR